jgi:acyl-coenzyme A thioesterase PaaI-like protein
LTALEDEPVGAAGDDEAGPGGSTARVSASRLAAAAALRRLGHALVSHEVDDDVLDRMTEVTASFTAEIEAGPDRVRAPFDMVREVFVVPPRQGGGRSSFAHSIVTGKANPLGIAADVMREGEEAVLRTTLGPAFEGAPGRAHGGSVAALFDEVMGFVLSVHATTAYTGSLTVTYRAPTPLGVELELRSRLKSRHGRKLRIVAEARHADALLAEADGLFIAVDPERFAQG